MATSEPLVPTSRPYGERQKLESQMQLAGVSTGLPTSPGAPTGRSAPSAPQGVPPDFDVFAGREPQGPSLSPISQEARFRDLLLSSPSPFWREVASRTYGV